MIDLGCAVAFAVRSDLTERISGELPRRDHVTPLTPIARPGPALLAAFTFTCALMTRAAGATTNQRRATRLGTGPGNARWTHAAGSVTWRTSHRAPHRVHAIMCKDVRSPFLSGRPITHSPAMLPNVRLQPQKSVVRFNDDGPASSCPEAGAVDCWPIVCSVKLHGLTWLVQPWACPIPRGMRR